MSLLTSVVAYGVSAVHPDAPPVNRAPCPRLDAEVPRTDVNRFDVCQPRRLRCNEYRWPRGVGRVAFPQMAEEGRPRG